MKRIFTAVLIALGVATVIASPALAADEQPGSVSLSDITVFEDLLVDGDFLAVVPYAILYTATPPDESIDKTYIFRMMNAAGTEVMGAVTAYPYYESGYGSGIVSFYFETGTTWETAYIFSVVQSPAYFTAPVYWDFDIGPTNYSADEYQVTALESKVLVIARTLSIEYSVELVESNSGVITLSTDGDIYFQNAIPGLSAMCPTLFAVQTRAPSYAKRSWDYTVAEDMLTKYDDTFIGDFMTGFAGMFSVETASAMNFVSIILFAILILISVKLFKGSTYSGFMDGYAFLILLMLNGFFSMILAGFIAFIGVVAGGVVLFLNRS